MARHRVPTAFILLIVAAACGGESAAEPDPQQLKALHLSHLTRFVEVDRQITIDAYAYDANSNLIPIPPLEWSSDDPAIAAVDAGGRVTGNAVGSAIIRAVAGDIEGSIRIDVRPPELSIVWQQGPGTLLIGESATIRAELRSSSGRSLPPPPNLFWATTDPDLVELSPIPGDPSQVRVTALATGLAAVSVGVEGNQSVEIIGIVAERSPSDAPLRVDDFYFFTYWDQYFGYMPTLKATVAPGRSVQLLRLEVAVPGMLPKELPALCSDGKLVAGQHTPVGLASYPLDALYGYGFFEVSGNGGAALLTYRADDGRVITTVLRGSIDVWGYDYGYPTQFPWQVCTPAR
jgi:hypothetical protein